MANKKLLQDFLASAVSAEESKCIKGGRASYVPTGSGSHGVIVWEDVDVRYDGIVFKLRNHQSSMTLNSIG